MSLHQTILYTKQMDPPFLTNGNSTHSKGQEFQHILMELKQTVNTLDETFLLKLVQALQLKPYLSSEEVSSIAILFCLAAQKNKSKVENQQALDCANQYEKMQDLHKIFFPYRSQNCLRLVQPNIVQWIYKIWKKLVHYSCYRNYLDITCIFYFIGQSFPKIGEELQKLITLLLHSSSKFKTYSLESLVAILELIQFYIKEFQNKQICPGLKIKLKILKILFLSKFQRPREQQVDTIKNALKQFIQIGIEQLIQITKACQQFGNIKEQEVIWQKLFNTVLTYYHRQPMFQSIAKQFLMEMINFKIDMQAVKLMIKELEITNQVDPAQKWKQIFGLMNFTLSVYPVTKQIALFKSNTSFLKIYLNQKQNFTMQLEVKCISKNYEEQKFLFMIKSKSKKEQLWITSCSQSQNKMKLILLKVCNKNILEKFQKIVSWKQYNQNKFTIEFNSKQIKITVNKMEQNTIEIKRFIENVDCVVVGDQDNTLGTSITYFLSLHTYAENSKQKKSQKNYKIDLNSKMFQWKQVVRKVVDSFIDIIKAAGDLDIFLLIISHAFKKLKTDPRVIDMVRHSLVLMEHFVQFKRVKNVKLSLKERQERGNAILCLCWQCSHESRNALAVLQLLRVLRVRGNQNFQEQLEILCNFVFWKHFEWEYQKLIILKIKEIFMQARIFQLYRKKLHQYCKRILLEAVIFYREEDTFNCPQQKSQVLKIHHEFIELVQEQFLYQIQNLKQIQLIESSLQFLLRLLSLTLSKKYGNSMHNFGINKAINTHDIIFSVQLSLLLRRLCKKLKVWNSKQDLLLKLIAYGLKLSRIYKQQQKQFEERKYRIYEKQRGFINTNENIIKQNIYFALQHLISLKESLIYKMIEQQEPGVAEIACITWQNQFFQTIIKSKTESQIKFQTNSQILKKLSLIKQKLPLKYLSLEQNKMLLRIYLRSYVMFPWIDFKLQSHFWNIIGIKQALQIIKIQLFQSTKESNQTTPSSSKTLQNSTTSKKEVELFQKKILSLLIVCDSLLSHQAIAILKFIQFLYSQEKTKEFQLVYFHFTLKNLLENIEELKKSNQSRMSCEQNQTKPSDIYQQQSQCSIIMTRYQFIKCIEFYNQQLTIKDIMMIKGLQKGEECNCHYQNYKINLAQIIKILSKAQPNIISKVKIFGCFIKQHLLNLSKYYLQSIDMIDMIPFFNNNVVAQRKGSRHLLELPKVQIIQESENMYHKFVQQRKLALLNVQTVWSKVEERNKYFWSIFLGNQMEYNLHQATGLFNEKYLLKKSTKKAKYELPRMIRTSIVKSASIMSERFQFNQETESASSIFDDAKQYSKDPNGSISSKSDLEPNKQRKSNLFAVMLITSSKIYQGTLNFVGKKLIFKETQRIDEELYKKIYASQSERRTSDQCIAQNFKFQQELSSKCVAITKRYLFHDLALEFLAKNRSYLFTFVKKGHRQAFLLVLEKLKVITLNRTKLIQQTKKTMQMWENGQISNFKYLMRLNNFVGRSFNDLSQYYIFPWSIVNYSTTELDLSFFTNKQNFRDLSLPSGKLSKSKWQNIKKNFQRTKKDDIPGIRPFLYGSFYSNPAIVSNFLIRINPFASQHFQLQSNQFDLPDRLFYSIQDSFKSLIYCSSDFKELIPQFYYFPEFLKNRNKYNLGSRQNKDIVNNVILPKWAQNQYQFVFKMRKILESQHVTSNLHNWIDLIFGVYAKKEYALKADNLFLENLYIDSYKAYINDKNKQYNMYFKEFGQVPVPIFNSNHLPCKYQENFLDLLGHELNKQQQIYLQKATQIGKLLHVNFAKRYTFLLFENEVRMYLDQQFGDKDFVSVSGQFKGGNIYFWQISQRQKKKQFLIVHRKSTCQLVGYQIKKSIFNRYSLEGGEVLQFKHKVELFAIYDSYVICSQAKIMYIYKKVEQTLEEDYSSNNFSIFINIVKNKYSLNAVSQFTQHTAKIKYLEVTQKGMLVSMDEQNKIFIIELGGTSIQVFNYFSIRNTYFQQKVVQILIHNLGFIILRTDYDRLMMFSFLGDKIIDKIIHFQPNNSKNNNNKEFISSMCFWNQDFCQLLFATTNGYLWKIDAFYLKRQQELQETMIWIQKICLNPHQKHIFLSKVAVNRIGRYCLALVSVEGNKLYTIKSNKWEQIKKIHLQRKKAEDFW